MKLYYSQGACSLAPHIILKESGLNFTTEEVDFKTMTTKSGKDFLKINPKGYVPTLELDSGEVLTEGAVILQYIADHVQEKNLIPRAGSMERYRCQEWLTFIGTEIHKNMGSFFHPAFPETYKSIVLETLSDRYDYLSNQLKGKNFLMGSQFTVADAYLFTVLSWAPHVKIDLSKWPTLLGFLENVKMRTAVQKTLEAEGLL